MANTNAVRRFSSEYLRSASSNGFSLASVGQLNLVVEQDGAPLHHDVAGSEPFRDDAAPFASGAGGDSTPRELTVGAPNVDVLVRAVRDERRRRDVDAARRRRGVKLHARERVRLQDVVLVFEPP